ncbi:response regulator [Vibrio pectenicida]|uniref:histidine kinase n=1 Tax=Vibrio pectenicida TaxID=62763 RepID=A0A7Y3ZXW9_9VIBR|nr:response regulator [Vibrio pectenicida]NOH70977.1 response regulator [Vibrio pectenicida]
MKNKRRYLSINKKLLFAVTLISIFLALTTTSYNLYYRLQLDIDHITKTLSNIKNSQLSSITGSLWVEDRVLLESQIEGLLTLPGVDYANIWNDRESVIEKGERLSEGAITQIWPLEYQLGGKNYVLGNLIIQSDLTRTYASLWSQFVHILSAESVRIMLLLTSVLFFTWFFVIKRINLMEKIVSSSRNNQSLNKIFLPSSWFNDEITHLADKFNQSGDIIEAHYSQLNQAREDAERAKDEAIRASKAKSSFLANMSHEIRTPLNGVIGISEVLSDTSLTATQRDYVDTIETSSHLLLNLINDILDFSKIESGMLVISPNSTNVRESIYDIVSIVSPRAQEKEIDLRVTVSSGLPYCLMIDDHRLRQVIMNFMSNAVKFTEKGSVHLSVITRDVTAENAIVEFSVHDSGIGIDEQQQNKIFEPFKQEDDSTTRQFGGTGLGLAISTQLVELMGGKIQLESEKNQGSRFFFQLSLPIAQMDYNSKHTSRLSPLCLVCDDKVMEEQLCESLNFYHAPVYQSITSLDYLPKWVHEKDNVIVIYVETSPNTAVKRESLFRHLKALNIHVCLMKHLRSQQYDFGENVSAIITQPLLGQRLVKLIERLEQDLEQSSTQELQRIRDDIITNKILVVDDNEVNRKIATIHVEKAGFSFDLAENGQQAVEMFKKHHYALILMDCMMPVMDGFEATEQIRQIEHEENRAKRIPIIALTASVVDEDIQKCFKVGMDDYVAKPFKAEVLRGKLTIFVSQYLVETLSLPTASEPQKVSVNLEPNDSVSDCIGRILLVEDNNVNQKVASLMLSKAGYQFEIAENGQVALDKYEQDSSFDIILMDCMMPVMDGFEATQKIRKYEHCLGLAKTPIIALTASVVDDDIRRCFDSGMDAYLPKPFRKETLLNEIESITS